MYIINRSVAIIRPKQPFIDWANQLPDAANLQVTADNFKTDCKAILISEYSTDEEAREIINEMWEDIFVDELFGWCTNESWWPKNLTKDMFWNWFDVEFHSFVIDPYEDEIEKEEQ
jgi:hypothetical protein